MNLAPLDILIATPAPPRARNGNRVTALRWAAMLRSLGHRVRVTQEFTGQPADLLIALHALKSAPSVRRFTQQRPGRPIAVGLAGTDVYPELALDPEAMVSLESANRLIALQPLATKTLPEELRERVRVIFQSAHPPPCRGTPDPDWFDACLIANLRPVKDPLLPARATRLLPAGSRVRVVHVGRALDDRLAREATDEAATNDRFSWLGGKSRSESLRVLSSCRVMIVSSRSEGGSNVLTEALAAGVPILTTEIPGSMGILGSDYPGTFPVGDAAALAKLLRLDETDARFRAELEQACATRAALVDPARERKAWAELLAELLPCRP